MSIIFCLIFNKDQGSLHESMDALFIGRKKTAGKSIRSPLFGTILFGDDKTVEQFVEQYPSSTERGEQELCFKMFILCLSELTNKISKFQK